MWLPNNSGSFRVVLLKPNGSVCDHVVPLKEDVVMHGYTSYCFSLSRTEDGHVYWAVVYLISNGFEKHLGTLKNNLVRHRLPL